MFRYSPLEVAEIERQVQLMIEQGLIEPSTSPYGAPILLVKKKDGSWRVCIDYRALNKITIKNSYPIPRIDDLLDKLSGARYFSTLDLMMVYHQLPLRESDIPKTAFKTPVGLFQYKVLSLGLTNAPSAFQMVMNNIFREAGLNRHVLVYLDDIRIFSRTEKNHLKHIRQVLEVFKKYKLAAKKPKCHFFKKEVEYLGHVVSAQGVRPDPKKIETVKNWPQPQNQSEVRSFLGLTNYFRRFVMGYAKIADPLIALTAKNMDVTPFPWTRDCTDAFEALKAALTKATVLTLPDFNKPFTIVADASQVGIGGVLLQDDRPIAFESHRLSSTERNYSTADRELYAVVYCLKKWRCYVQNGHPTTIYTDHKPNVTIDTKYDLSPRQVRWIEYTQQFNLEWKWIKQGRN